MSSRPFAAAYTACLALLCSLLPARGYDVNWCQAGIRPWYGGCVLGEAPSTTPVADTFLINAAQGDAISVKHQAWAVNLLMSRWDFTSNADEPVLKPAEEGPFWIHPARLAPLRPGESFVWQGQERLVLHHEIMTPDRLPICPFPVKAMFQLSGGQRDIVWFKSNLGQDAVSERIFDVETGLMIHRYDSTGQISVTLSLMEINYDFAAKAGFAEDAGPHTGFGLLIQANQAFCGAITASWTLDSRYRNFWAGTMFYFLQPPNAGAGETRDDVIVYDADRNVAMGTRHVYPLPPADQWVAIGDHWFGCIPVRDLSVNELLILGSTLTRTGGRAVFTGAPAAAGPGFRMLAFDDRGYATDLAILNQAMGLNIDTSQAPNRQFLLTGPNDYAAQLKMAAPSGIPLIRSRDAEPSTPPPPRPNAPVALSFGKAFRGPAIPRVSVPNPPAAEAGLVKAKADFEALLSATDALAADRLRMLDETYAGSLGLMVSAALDRNQPDDVLATRKARDQFLRSRAFPVAPAGPLGASLRALQSSYGGDARTLRAIADKDLRRIVAAYEKSLDQMLKLAGSPADYNAIEKEKRRIWDKYGHMR